MSGGTKKFLYTGPKSKQDDDDEWDFNPIEKSAENNKNSFETNLENVWSIKKNVALASPVPKKTDAGLSLNVGKGFYSRHAALKDEDLNHQNITGNTSPGGHSWSQPSHQSRYSYTNTTVNTGTSHDRLQAAGSPSSISNTQQGSMGRLRGQTNPNVQSTGVNVQSTGKHTKSRYF